jgi:LysR family transcriptional regulator, regulator for metE and metH
MEMNVKLEIRHLRLLAAVAETGSVTEAGRKLHLTQSALSHQLRDAEERLGAALFLRLGKRMVLTPAGEKLLCTAQKVLDDLQTAESQVVGLNGGTRGLIRISTECYTCYHWLPPVLNKFHKRFPRVEISIDAEYTHRPIEALLDGRLDVAILNCTSIPRNPSLRLVPMFEDEMVLVMSPKHPLAKQSQISPKDLAGETALIYPPREESTLLGILHKAGVEPERILEIQLTEGIIELAAAGNGIGFLARWAVVPHEEAGKLALRSLGKGGFKRVWHAATLKNQPTPTYVAEFLETLAAFYPKQPKLMRA